MSTVRPHNFQVGDLVKRTKPGGTYPKGYTFIIDSFVPEDAEYELARGFAKTNGGELHSPNYLELVKPAWRPQSGDMIEVAHHQSEEQVGELRWQHRPRKFIKMLDDRYLCKANDDPEDFSFYAYKNARPRQSYKITLENGTEVKISRESYEALMKGVES